MKKITVRNIPDYCANKLNKYAKKLKISQNALIVQILENFVEGHPKLPYTEINLKLKYLEENTDVFYFYDDWKTKTNDGKKPYPRILDEIDLGTSKKGSWNR